MEGWASFCFMKKLQFLKDKLKKKFLDTRFKKMNILKEIEIHNSLEGEGGLFWKIKDVTGSP